MEVKLLFKTLLLGLLPGLCVAKGVSPAEKDGRQERGFYFMENVGQIVDQEDKQRSDIDYAITANGVTLFVGDGQMHYQFSKIDNEEELKAHDRRIIEDPTANDEDVLPLMTYHRVDVELVGANREALAIPSGKTRYYEMFYNQFSPEEGFRSDAYGKVTYKEVYPNIDWVIYTKSGSFKYEFVVRPGGDVSKIKLKYSGATSLKLDEKGGLKFETPLGNIYDEAPVSFDESGNEIASSFVLNGNMLSYKVSGYSGSLTIDPTVTWGTYYGGNSTDYSYGVSALDDGSAVYMSGYTRSSINMATSGSHQQTLSGTYDAYLVKFDDNGVRQWATYYGGTGSSDYGYGAATDESGNIFICGRTNTTSGSGIATSGTQQPSHGGSSYDGWVAKFNGSGVRQWGTYCGGSGTDYTYGLATDNLGNVVICGYTTSSNNIATPFAAQPYVYGTPEGYVVKYDGSNGQRIWGTYCGGGSTDYSYAVTCDASNNVYVTGYSYGFISGTMITSGAHQSSIGGSFDAYLIKLEAAQGTVLWGTYIGGSNSDYGYALATDDDQNVYILGGSSSTNGIATTGAYQASNGGGNDVYFGKFDSTGTVDYISYYGGSGSDYATLGGMLAVDLNNNVWIGGYTYSSNGIASGGIYNSISSTPDAFIAKMLPDETRDWGTYYGGSSTDVLYGLDCDMMGNVYACGYTYSSNQVVTTGAHQTSLSSTPDGWLVKILDCPLPVAPGTISGATTVCQGNTETYTVTAVTGATMYEWSLPNGWTDTSSTNSITVTPNDTSGTIRVRAGVACGFGPWSAPLNVTALPAPGATITPSGPTTFCDGANVTLNANTGTGYTYVWKQGTTVLSTTTNSHVVSTSGNYTVEITGSNSCTSTSAAEVVIVNPNPIINFPTLSATCTNNPAVSLLATPVGGTYTGGGVTDTLVDPMAAGAGIHTIVYSYTDSNGCSSTANQSLTVNPAPTVNLPSFGTICSDVVVPLNMATPPGGIYSGIGVSGGNFDPQVSGLGTFNVTYTYTDGNNCTAAHTEPITVNPLTATNFPSIDPQCIDAPVVNLTATPAGGTFSGPGVVGNQFNPGTGAGNHVIHYDYTNQYGCTAHDSEVIVVNALPVLQFPAMDSVCNDAPLTMMATPAGGVYTGPGAGTGNVLNTSQAGVGTHTIMYTYTDGNACTNMISQTVTVHQEPLINAQPALYVEICEGEALGLNVGASNVAHYQWQQNGVDIAGANSNLYYESSAQPMNTGNYQVIITGTGACSNVQLTSTTAAVLINPLPPVNLTPGSDTVCQGDTIILNSGLNNSMNFQWRLNGNSIAGATSPTLAVGAPGVYRVFVTNQNTGCNVLSPEVTFGFNPSPNSAISYNGATEFCDGDDLMITNLDTGTGSTFQWLNNGNAIGGATAQSYTATATGVYTVEVTNTYNCTRTSDTVAVTVNPLPTPVVTVLDAFGNMTTGVYSYYQWNLNGNAIAGANSQTYQATAQGTYTVTVRDDNGCENTSASKDPLSVNSAVKGNSNFALYPNPNSGTFTIEGTLASDDGKVAMEIVDATGKLVYREDVKISANKLSVKVDISGVAAGAYMIRIVSDNAREVIPFVKR